jgi:hypothetical protein
MSSGKDFFWALSINGVLSREGADSMQPGPGSTVHWEYTPVPANPEQLPARTRISAKRWGTATSIRPIVA